MTQALIRVPFVAALVACQARQSPTDRPSIDSAAPATARSAPSASALVASDSAAGALAVLRGYYAALNAHDYGRAYAAWGPTGPPGAPTPAEFAKGYARTDSVELTPGTPGRVEGAAGSRYVGIPVTLRAFERGGRETTFAGSYTLRRSVVPGADAASRRWHLYQATLHARPVP